MIYDLDADFEIKKLGNGFYLFGNKKVYCKVINERLVVRVGGGYEVAEKFIENLKEF